MAPISGIDESDLLDSDKFNSYMSRKFQYKAVTDGGGSRISRNAPNSMKRLHESEIVLYLHTLTGKVHIGKNKMSGKTGEVSTKELIEILTRILVRHVFGNKMKLFQAGMQIRLKGAIKKIVKEGA